MEAEEYLRKLDAYSNTKGCKRLENIVCNIVETEYFQNKAEDIREKCGISVTAKDSSDRFQTLMDKLSEKDRRYIKKELKDLCKKYTLSYFDWSDTMRYYLFFGKIKKMDENHNAFNMCLISNLAEEEKDPFGKDVRESDNIAYPIAIRISPYASKRDILDFINKIYPDIKDYQEESINSKSSIWYRRIGNPKKRERNKFIYKNKDLPLKKIARLVSDEFEEILDDGHIGKIISFETKRRKEV
jgi:hypothetical protein